METGALGLANFILEALSISVPAKSTIEVMVEMENGTSVIGASLEQTTDDTDAVTYKIILRPGALTPLSPDDPQG